MAATATRPTNTDWAEDEGEGERTSCRGQERLARRENGDNKADLSIAVVLPSPVETHDASTGITTIVSYKKDESGRTVKVSTSSIAPFRPLLTNIRLRDASGGSCRLSSSRTLSQRGSTGPSG